MTNMCASNSLFAKAVHHSSYCALQSRSKKFGFRDMALAWSGVAA